MELVSELTSRFPNRVSPKDARDTGEFKQPRRRRQRVCQKTIRFNEHNNDSARAIHILVHFLVVLCKTSKSNDQF